MTIKIHKEADFEKMRQTIAAITPPEAPRRPPRKKSSDEDELMNRLLALVGAKEMEKNGGGWRIWFRENPVAVREAVADLKNRLISGDSVKNRGSWLNNAYQRIRKERGQCGAAFGTPS